MSSEAKPLARPPGLGVAPPQAEHSMELAKADAAAGKGEVAEEPRVFPRRRPDLSDAHRLNAVKRCGRFRLRRAQTNEHV